MIIRYEFVEKFNLLIQKFTVDFNLKHYMQYATHLLEQPEWKNIERVLTDFRSIDPIGALENLDTLTTFRKGVIKKEFLSVFVVDSPVSTAISHLYQEELLKSHYSYRYCSTIEEAGNLLCLEGLNLNEKVEHLKYELAESEQL